jgi:hypothetical protein
VSSAPRQEREQQDGPAAYSLATPDLARSVSERAYFITWERSVCPMSSASSLTCPGLACKNQVPNVRLRSWGFMSTFFMPLFAEAARSHRVPVGGKWHVDETYCRLDGR